MEPSTGLTRPSGVPRLLLPSLAVATFLVAGCGASESENSAVPASTAQPTPADITCPSGYTGGTDGGEYPEENPPKGYETPDQAAQAWLDDVYPRSEYMLMTDGLFVLRDDGTASARAFWLDGVDDYLVDGYRACAPAPKG